MAYTAADLAKAMKKTWSKEPVFTKAFDMGQGSLNDLKRQTAGQMYFTALNTPTVHTSNPFLYANREHGVLAQKKKPSYRQRQKNGRAGRKK